MKDYIICDLDGTLCDVTHREHFVQSYPKDWEGWNAGVPHDGVHGHVRDLLNMAYLSGVVDIVFCSGRDDIKEGETRQWLDRNVYLGGYELHMRPHGNYEKDHVIKERMLTHLRDQYGRDPLFVIDDRPSVIDMWEEQGVKVFATNYKRWDVKTSWEKGMAPSLILMVGPSGSGKTTYLKNNCDLRDVVSSDHIRDQILIDPSDMSKNSQVFAALHKVVKSRLEAGLTTIVDATNIRNRDRLAIKALAPEGTRIHYIVMANRNIDEVKKTGGWRNEIVDKNGKTLIERHFETFRSNWKDIVTGDGDESVTIGLGVTTP